MFLTKISELLEKLTERRNHQSRIRGMDRDAEEFSRDVSEAGSRVARDLIDRPASESARELTRACETLRPMQSNMQPSSNSAARRRNASWYRSKI